MYAKLIKDNVVKSTRMAAIGTAAEPKRIGRLLTGTAIAVGLAFGLAVVPSKEAEAAACGFYVQNGWAWYRHCTGAVYTRVQVKIDTWRGPGSYICAKPGDVGLGPSSSVKFAYYTGKLC
ncbi:DUF6355 family natural product biosynthesis protein [Nostoc sp. ChiQUE01b]|uniref:DUF6355 family natural product biosynthesis protein n=1 Tax=Nostoc sp. ChiQUE01b TaxID=3075376 RepID=UPI003A0FFF4D